MTTLAVLWVCLPLLTVVLQGCYGDPCRDYTALSPDKRMRFNFLEDVLHAICDSRLPDAWYRVVDGPAGSDMITTCPHTYSCGTVFPIWLKGQLPGQGREKRMKTCVRSYSDCCSNEVDVTVKNCGTYNVYFLTASQVTKCDSAFCFGDKALCPAGQSSETGFMPGCSADFPQMGAPADVELYTQWIRDSGQLYFHCKPPTPATHLFYDVDWFYEEVKVHSARAVSSQRPKDADMSDEHWFRNGRTMGFNVHCKMRARKTQTGTPSPWKKSPVKYIGIELRDTTLRVPEGEVGKVPIKLTAPFPCPPNLPNPRLCGISLVAEIPVWKGDCKADPVYTVQDNCRLAIYGNEWNQLHHFNIKTKSDDLVLNKEIKNYVRFRVADQKDYPTWSGHRLPTVTVTIFDTDYKTKAAMCTSYNDPHFTTFDGKKYDHHGIGEFMLYKHRTKPVEIHAVFQPCRGHGVKGAACNCGVAVRAGYDLYAIYSCNDGFTMEGEIACGGLEHLQIGMSNGGDTTWIKMPTGAVLRVKKAKAKFVNLELDVGQGDRGATSGLCGSLDGNPRNDLKKIQENNFYRVSPADSFFKRPGQLPPWDEQQAGVCQCDSRNRTADLTCDWSNGVKGCLPPGFQDRSCHRTRTKRALLQEDYVAFDLDAVQIVEAEDQADLTWKGNWTEAKAREFCRNFINRSSSAQRCQEALNMDATPSLEMCVLDIQLSGSVDWALEAIERLKGSCMREVSRDSKYWDPPANQSETTSSPLAGLLEELQEVTCPEECNFRGACVNGTCECQEGYRGSSCDVNMALPPNVAHIPFGGLCDVSKRPCRMAVVYGDSFANTSSLACKAEAILVTDTGVQTLDQSHVTKAYFESYGEVLCSLPLQQKQQQKQQQQQEARKKRSIPPGAAVGGRGFLLSVANDGQTFGRPRPFVTFNPACQECSTANGSLRCVLKKDTCFIEGACYVSEESKEGQPCLQCNPALHSTSWSQQTESCLIEGECYAIGDKPEGQASCLTCQPSFSSTQWQLQPAFCRIDGLCVSNAAENPRDPCLVCDSSVSSSQWSRKAACQDKKLWLIGVIVGLVLVIAVIVAIIVWKVKSNRARKWSEEETGAAVVKFSPEPQ